MDSPLTSGLSKLLSQQTLFDILSTEEREAVNEFMKQLPLLDSITINGGGAFISLEAAKDLRREYKEWAKAIPVLGNDRNQRAFYVSTKKLHKLLERISPETDFIQVLLGKKDNELKFMFLAVDKDGRRYPKPEGSSASPENDDVLDEIGVCPPPRCQGTGEDDIV